MTKNQRIWKKEFLCRVFWKKRFGKIIIAIIIFRLVKMILILQKSSFNKCQNVQKK
uniref:Uncharacterized protein n=1 Tax=viral metagenome TaxID=1070528 RepID=A0A6C0KU75_9ZZZZ